jgi:Flp pilus assembly protein CpaB
MRELRSWIFLGLGLLLAGLTGLALYGVAQQYGTRQVAAASDVAEVVVVNKAIAARTVLTTDFLATKTFPRNLVPEGALTNKQEAVGQTTLATIPSGGVVLRTQLTQADGKSGASIAIEKGKVLVAFPTTDPLTGAGLVQVGDHIDVLATIAAGADGTRKTQTMLQNLEVISVLGPTREQPQRASSLTFYVDHQVALVLKYLRDSQATVDIVVRSRSEGDLSSTSAVDLTYLLNTYGIKR